MANVEIYSKFLCPFCSRAKSTLKALGVDYKSIEITFSPSRRAEMIQRSGRTTVPQIFIGDHHVGGSDDLEIAKDNGQLNKLLTSE